MPMASSGTQSLNMIRKGNRADVALKSRMATAPTRLVLRSTRLTKPQASGESKLSPYVGSSSSSASPGNRIPTRVKLESLKTTKTVLKDPRATFAAAYKNEVNEPLQVDEPSHDSKLEPDTRTAPNSSQARDFEVFISTIVQLKKGDRDKLHALLEILQKVDEDYEESSTTKVPSLMTVEEPAVVKRKADGRDSKPLDSPTAKSLDFSSLKARISLKKSSASKNLSTASLYPKSCYQDASSDSLPSIWIRTLNPVDVCPQLLYPVDLVLQGEPIRQPQLIPSMEMVHAVPAMKPNQPNQKAINLFRQTVKQVQPFKPVTPVQKVQPFESMESVQTNLDLLREAFKGIEGDQLIEVVGEAGTVQLVKTTETVHAVKPSYAKIVKSVQNMQQPVKPLKPSPNFQSDQPTYCQPLANIRDSALNSHAAELLYYSEGAHGRTAKVVDPTWGKAIIETFSTKYPLTGTLKAAPPPVTTLFEHPVSDKRNTAPPKVVKGRDAAVIQERLEVLLLQQKENKFLESFFKET